MTLIDRIRDVRHAEEPVFDAIKASSAPVVLWGAGEIAWYVWAYLRQHGIEPECFCDNDPAKQGTVYIGLPVYSYGALREKYSARGGKYCIVVATGIQYREPVFSQLAGAREKNMVCHLRGYEVYGEKLTYRYFRENAAQFEKACSLLADERSRQVFVNVLNAKISGDFGLYKESLSRTEYFDPEVVRLAENEVFLDVGAYKGNAILEFAKLTKGKYDGIIAVEPDDKARSVLEGAIAADGIRKVEIHRKAAWNKRGLLHFHGGLEGGSRLSESPAGAAPPASLEVEAIDDLLNGRRVTYISMDIEGAERNALLGAEQTIRKWKPRLAVCVYHKREDMFDLLLLIRSLVPQYEFYMRHYSEDQTQTVLYAIAPASLRPAEAGEVHEQ